MKWRSLEESAAGSDTRALREIYAERKQSIARYVPADTQAVHARAVAELKAQQLADHVLSVGAMAPVFELPDHNGKMVSSGELLSRGPVVICFFRGRWCPFCVGQLEAMNLIAPDIQKSGASLLAISPQTIQQSSFMHDQHQLRFPLLSDAGNQVARHFRLVYRVPDYQQNVYRSVFVKLPFTNGDDSWELPIPATFILAQDGAVLYASANEDYTERPEPADILAALRA